MIVTLKNLQQKTFSVEIAGNRTVGEFKEEIFTKMGADYPVDRQKLIYSGAILQDERTLDSYNIDEKKFVVIMVTQQVSGTSTSSPQPNNAETRTAHTTNYLYDTGSGLESTFVTGQEYENAVAVFVEMGFSRELVERAMTAGFHNPERAMEYLVDGIPENLEDGSNVGEDDFGLNTVRDLLDALRRNPALLRSALHNVGVTDENVTQQIIDNPDGFLSTLNQIDANQNGNNAPSSVQNTQNSTGIQNNSQPGANYVPDLTAPPVVQLNGTEREAVDRIKAMGFPEHRVLQAFLACEKNEELTVNFLLSNNEE